MNTPILTSIVVTAHNSQETITQCLLSIDASRSTMPENAEIILVDDRSKDATAEAAQKLGLKNFRIIQIDNYHNGALTARQVALEKGIREARGKYIFLADSDALVPENWLTSVLPDLESASTDVIAGMIQFRGKKTIIRSIQNVDVLVYFFLCRFLNSLRMPTGVFFGNIAFRKEVFEKIGGFKAIGFSLTEDLAFAQSLCRFGFSIEFKHESAVSVNTCKNWKNLVKRTHRVSANPFNWFSFGIWTWLMMFLLLFTLAIAGSTTMKILFAIRFTLGAGLLAYIILNSRRFSLIPMVFIFEILAAGIGILVLIMHALRQKIFWGSITYAR